MGLDDEELRFQQAGRMRQLTDIGGAVLTEIIAWKAVQQFQINGRDAYTHKTLLKILPTEAALEQKCVPARSSIGQRAFEPFHSRYDSGPV